MIYKHLKRQGINQWVSKLLGYENRGKKPQIELLKKVLGNDNLAFPAYVEKCIAGKSNSAYASEQGELPSIIDSDGNRVIEITEGHMYLMPANDALALYDAWEDIPCKSASTSTLWGAITLSEIRKKIIHPIWMHVDHKCDAQKAKEELDTVIRSSDNHKIDRSVRRVLRWMLAPGHMRGQVEIYSNHCLAKNWWLGHFATKVSRIISSLNRGEICNHLCCMWPELGDYLEDHSWLAGLKHDPRFLSQLCLWADITQDGSRNESIRRRTDTRKAFHSLVELYYPETFKNCFEQVVDNQG